MQSLALPRASQGPCESHEITVSTKNGLHVCMGWCLTCFFCSFSPYAAEIRSF